MTTKADKFDRDNIDVPVIVAEKRSVVVSDPEVQKGSDHLNLSLKEETILTMKKVSSLALV